MCLACGNVCCASDVFGECGCDGCHESACWTWDEYDGYDDDPCSMCGEVDCRCSECGHCGAYLLPGEECRKPACVARTTDGAGRGP